MAAPQDIPWLKAFAERWRQQETAGRAPHAVMLLGAPGVGKRAAAAWLAASRLLPDRAPAVPTWPPSLDEHPDLHRLTPPEDKHNILIDQVRELIAELSLTSHEGRGKVAIVEPANLMTNQSANGLLKTLEEPPGSALIILVADRMTRLPATILSRCQRISLRLPDERSSLDWLDRLQPGARWAPALAAAGGAPLAAIAALERLDDAEAMTRDLGMLAALRASPIEVAERWTKQYPDLALDALGRQVQRCIRRRAGGGGAETAVDDSVLQRMDSRNLFCYLDIINRLRGQSSGSFNLQLTLEGLLIDWAEGLQHCREPEGEGSLWPPAAR